MEKNSNAKTSGYKFSQIFGYKGPNETVQEEDIITCLKFDNEGKFIALGDKAGRVIIFENTNSS
jgi:serine/threonine-protein phosphatase 2A regulatory subunit B